MSITIETPRLMLRPPELGDWEAICAFLGSDRARHIGGPYTRAKAWRGFGHMVGHWTLRGFGLFVGIEKDSGAPVLSAGPWFPEGWPEHELAWSVWDARAEGTGLAAEAAIATRDWAYTELGLSTLVSYIDASNIRSAALAKRVGCVIDPNAPLIDDGEEDAHQDAYHVWRHPAADADGNPGAYA